MWVFRSSVVLYMFLILNINTVTSIAVGNANFNASLRDYSADDVDNVTNIRTLQREPFGRYASFAPARNPIKFKEIPDNALSPSSSLGRGLHHEHHGYGLLDYEDNPYYGHGYDFHVDPHGLHHHEDHGHHDYHDLHHYSGHHGDHHGHGYHHKHVAHALAAKTILWPIAGIALLGAAAALVTNPVLLQLGVVSGRRKRRETIKDTTEFDSNSLTNWFLTDPAKYISKTQVIKNRDNHANIFTKDDNFDDKSVVKRNAVIDRIFMINKRRNLPRKVTVAGNNADSGILRNKSDEDMNFIPVPLKTNNG